MASETIFVMREMILKKEVEKDDFKLKEVLRSELRSESSYNVWEAE